MAPGTPPWGPSGLGLAYLHPNVFSPDPEIRGELGAGEEGVGLVAVAALEEVAAQSSVVLEVPDHGLDGRVAAGAALKDRFRNEEIVP